MCITFLFFSVSSSNLGGRQKSLIALVTLVTVLCYLNVYPTLLWNKPINQCFVFFEPQLRQSTVISKSSMQQQLKQAAGGQPTTGDQW